MEARALQEVEEPALQLGAQGRLHVIGPRNDELRQSRHSAAKSVRAFE